MKVAVVGGGKMGLPLAAQFARRGADVTVCDINPGAVAEINAGRCPIDEPGVDVVLAEAVANGKLRATVDTTEGVTTADVVVVIVPVLISPEHVPDLSIIESASADIARGLRKGALVSYETTLPIGGTRRLATILERSGMVAGVDFDVAFSPERVKSQLVFQRLTENPKAVGGITPQAAARAAEFYAEYLGAEVVNVGDLETSEMVKLAGMIYRDVNIALSNELALFSERAGIDFPKVIEVANTDGEAFLLQPGIGVGGHCTPVYPHLLLRNAEALGIPMPLTAQGRVTNDARPHDVLDRVERLWGPLKDRRVLLLGLGFRPQVKEHFASPTFDLYADLTRRGAQVAVHDPLYDDDELVKFGFVPAPFDWPAEVLVLATAHDSFVSIDAPELKRRGVEVVVDGRNAWDRSAMEAAGLRYVGMGQPDEILAG